MRRPIRLLFFIVLGLPLSIQTYAQKGGLTAGLVYGVDRWKSDDLNTFINTFNTYYTQNTKSAFETTSSTLTAPMLRVGYRGFGLLGGKSSFAFLYQTGNSQLKRNFTFANDLKNELDLHIRNRDILVEVGISNPKGYINALMQGQFRYSKITYSTLYQDGSRSLGYEYDLNGVYELNISEIMAGISAGYRVGKRLTIPVTVSVPAWLPGGDFIFMTDYDTSRYRSNNFPREYDLWAQDRLGVDTENGLSESTFRGIRFTIGLEYQITR